MKKLHISEVLVVLVYLALLIFWFLFKKDVYLLSVQALDNPVLIGGFVALIVLSNWSMVHLKRVSIVLLPFCALLGIHAGQLGGDIPSWSNDRIAGIGIFIRAFFSIGILALQLLSCFIFARKDFKKISLLFFLSFAFAFVFDLIFINPQEMDVKGDYSPWRLGVF